MARLIDADALIEHIKEFTSINEGYFENPQLLMRVIEKQPVAYDVGKIVGQLEEAQDEYHKRMDDYDEDLGGYVAMDFAIDIVHNGGKPKFSEEKLEKVWEEIFNGGREKKVCQN